MRTNTRKHMLCSTLLIGLISSLAAAQEQAKQPIEVGIEEHLGDHLALDTLTFFDEEGKPIKLRDLFDRPIILTLVYYKCPGICTPLLLELSDAVDLCDLTPGEDYRMITISFDPKEGADLARLKKENMLRQLKRKNPPPDAWRFLTGDEQNIRAITDAVGFRYVPDRNKVDFVHAATVVFLSSDGMIARYLNGTEPRPADVKLAVIDAKDGRARSFMQKMQRLCYAYDAEGQAYVFQINRLILAVTLLFATCFGVFLLVRKPGRRTPKTEETGSVS